MGCKRFFTVKVLFYTALKQAKYRVVNEKPFLSILPFTSSLRWVTV